MRDVSGNRVPQDPPNTAGCRHVDLMILQVFVDDEDDPQKPSIGEFLIDRRVALG